MRKPGIRTVAGITLSLLTCLVFSARNDSTRATLSVAEPPAPSCSDQPKDCKLPTKYLGEKDGCACFACEYGKKTQRVICTDNKTNKELLMRQNLPKKAGLE
jgi:hypothetical protein